VLPASPAVFGAATVAYVVLPPLVANRVPGYAPFFSGLVTALLLALAAGAGTAPYPALLAGMAAVGLLCLAVTAGYSRRSLP
jgi:hypothetical protein